MHPFLNTAFTAARNAGIIISRALDRLDIISIDEKTQNDFVTDIDRKAEQEIIYTLRKAYPDHGILAEESGLSEGDDFTWIIDPLDGTTNFIHGFPHFAVSIALKYKNRLEHGLIYDPLRDEVFSATRGQGAKLNQRRIRVSGCHSINKAFLASGLPVYQKDKYLSVHMRSLESITAQCAAVRRAGSASLDLAYVAAGRLDGYWEFGLKPWDIAAGVLIVKEAGGLVCDFDGKDDYLTSGNIITTNAKLLKPILQAVQVFKEVS